MNENKFFLKYEAKVNKILILFLLSGAPTSLILAYFGIYSTYNTFIMVSLGAIASVVLNLNKKYKIFVPYVITVSSFMSILLLALEIPETATVAFIVSICIVVAYFNMLYVIINSSLSFVVLLYLEFFKHAFDMKIFIINFVCLMFSAGILIILTKQGKYLIFESNRRELEALENLNKIKGFTKKIADGNLESFDYYREDEVSEQFYIIANSIKSIISEVDFIANAILNGNLTVKGDTEKFKGIYSNIIQSVNNVIEAFLTPINESIKALTKLSKGNLDVRVEGDYKGDLALIKNSLNTTIEFLSAYINEISNVLNIVSSGNLNVLIENEYIGNFKEIKNSINLAVKSFNEVLNNINRSTKSVSESANGVSSSAQALAEASTEQATTIEELTATTDNIVQKVKNNANDSERSNEAVLNARNSINSADNKMKEMLVSIEDMAEESKNISKIIKVIDEMTFQTNILSLNASIEAAKAGQYGRGFSVVATEIRNLASRSAESAKEIETIIENSLKKTNDSIVLASDTSTALVEAVNIIAKTQTFIGNITVSSKEQLNDIIQIERGLTQFSQVVQNNSATAQESASVSEEMLSQAEILKSMVEKFTIKTENSKGYNSEYNNMITNISAEYM